MAFAHWWIVGDGSVWSMLASSSWVWEITCRVGYLCLGVGSILGTLGSVGLGVGCTLGGLGRLDVVGMVWLGR